MLNKVIYSILGILICIFIIIIAKDNATIRDYVLNYKYKGNISIVSVSVSNISKNKIFDGIKKIYDENNISIQDVNNKIKEYLLKNNINKFTINTNNIILLSNDSYKIGIPDPDNDEGIIKVIEAKGKCIATLKANKYFSSITVISNDKCEDYANALKDMTIEEGKKYTDIDIIWYTFDKKIISTNNI